MAHDYLTLSECARLSPGRPHSGTVWRWARKGVKARDGTRIRLRHIRAGKALYVHPQWLERFFEELAEADARHFNSITSAKSESPQVRTAPSPSKQHELAERELSRYGI